MQQFSTLVHLDLIHKEPGPGLPRRQDYRRDDAKILDHFHQVPAFFCISTRMVLAPLSLSGSTDFVVEGKLLRSFPVKSISGIKVTFTCDGRYIQLPFWSSTCTVYGTNFRFCFRSMIASISLPRNPRNSEEQASPVSFCTPFTRVKGHRRDIFYRQVW